MISFDRHTGNRMFLSLGSVCVFTMALNFRTGSVVDELQKRGATGWKKNSKVHVVT